MLIHSHQVVREKSLPIGMLSEEAQEARNKDFKRFRECFTRKSSRKNTNRDLKTRLLCSSDPKISILRRGHLKNAQSDVFMPPGSQSDAE